jgi:Fusaric acid resistance protein-like
VKRWPAGASPAALLDWLQIRDRGLAGLRRAGRAAIIMPALFALGDKVIANPAVATFAAFGSFSLLLLVDFGGPMRDRLQAQAALGVLGGVLVCLGTIASRSTPVAVVAMGLVAFAVLFAGVVSSVLAGATTSLLLVFILSVSLVGPISSIPDRLAGWGMAAGASLLAIALLWPAPERDALRGPAVAVCRALGARLRADVAYVLGRPSRPSPEAHAAAVAEANSAVRALHQAFFATPYRPTGLGTTVRAVVRLVDEVKWLNMIIVYSSPRSNGSQPLSSDDAKQKPINKNAPVSRRACAVKLAAASVLERGADLLNTRGGSPDALRAAMAELREALAELERGDELRLPSRESAKAADDRIGAFITSLDPDFRAQELSFVVSQIARNIDLAAAAERRSWLERLLGRQPSGLVGPLSAAQERAGAHVERNSVWLHNSVRGAVGLALAVLVAKLTGVQHSFWVVLGALSVLRSNALSTGQNVVRGLLGTVVGFIVGGVLVVLIGTNTTVLWVLLPPAVLFAGLAPAAISFAAGQAAFTLTLLILYNILLPAGWQLGLVRIEDIALGSAVSVAVGLLFWPRGAGAALGTALAAAYSDSVRYLAGAVEFGMGRCDYGVPSRPAPTDEAVRAAAASRRLDDTFRGYLAERGPKRAPLAEVTGLVNGAAGLRLAADAVLDLWQRDDAAGGDRSAAREELLANTKLMVDWYTGFAASLTGEGEVPEPLPQDELADGRLIDAVSHDLRREDGRASGTAARMIWTGDHLDAARRLQGILVGPAQTARRRHPPSPRWRILDG